MRLTLIFSHAEWRAASAAPTLAHKDYLHNTNPTAASKAKSASRGWQRAPELSGQRDGRMATEATFAAETAASSKKTSVTPALSVEQHTTFGLSQELGHGGALGRPRCDARAKAGTFKTVLETTASAASAATTIKLGSEVSSSPPLQAPETPPQDQRPVATGSPARFEFDKSEFYWHRCKGIKKKEKQEIMDFYSQPCSPTPAPSSSPYHVPVGSQAPALVSTTGDQSLLQKQAKDTTAAQPAPSAAVTAAFEAWSLAEQRHTAPSARQGVKRKQDQAAEAAELAPGGASGCMGGQAAGVPAPMQAAWHAEVLDNVDGHLDDLFSRIGYAFNHPELLQALAFIVISEKYRPHADNLHHNHGLVDLGHRILVTILTQEMARCYWQLENPDQHASYVALPPRLFRWSIQLGLPGYAASPSGLTQPQVADLTKALFGAIFLDGGQAAVRQALSHILDMPEPNQRKPFNS
ncbi:hypothetical protein WJX73_006574 [Symbiochloris irregularis]|uniref:RNase III domain-containing protein n=1 Tax=Symbiochloris irregularis TaxID=706552 RepID=A0AAW1P6S3_9CHLO